MARNLQPPPSGLSGPLGAWLRDLHTWVEGQVQFSYASFGDTQTPNSRVTALSGAICVNVGSGVTKQRHWILGGSSLSGTTDQGWQLVTSAAP